MIKKLLAFSLFTQLCLVSASSQAKILWQGDFETSDLSQWHRLINPQALALNSNCSFDGKHSGQVTLAGTPDLLWKGRKDLNRSEFHFTPAAGSTAEGKQTFFSFSFYLPKALSKGRHELGYWESETTWQQMLRFNISGTDFSLQETAAKVPVWTLKKGAAPGKWHRVAMQIHWSIDATKGGIQVWFDGKDMGLQQFQTLYAADSQMFSQIGILRNQQDRVEKILIDGAMETDNLTELLERDRANIGKTCKKI
jgi:hypothetical protein